MEYRSDVELARRFGVSRVTIWRWSSQGILPKPVAIGPNSSRWLEDENRGRGGPLAHSAGKEIRETPSRGGG